VAPPLLPPTSPHSTLLLHCIGGGEVASPDGGKRRGAFKARVFIASDPHHRVPTAAWPRSVLPSVDASVDLSRETSKRNKSHSESAKDPRGACQHITRHPIPHPRHRRLAQCPESTQTHAMLIFEKPPREGVPRHPSVTGQPFIIPLCVCTH